MMTTQQSPIDPVAQSNIPLFGGPLASERPSKSGDKSGFHSEKSLQCRRTHTTCEPSEKDGPGSIPTWSNRKTALLDSRIHLNKLSGTKGQNHLTYRPDNRAFSLEEPHYHSSYVHKSPSKQVFTYTWGPEISMPIEAPQQTAGDVKCIPPSENYLVAVPKPIYGHSSTCNGLGGVFGQRSSLEHGPQRMPSTVFEREWMHAGAHHSNPSSIQKTTELLPSTGTIPIKKQKMSPNESLLTYIDANSCNYIYAPTRSPFELLAEQSQCLQTTPNPHHGLHLSHPPIYGHMISPQHGIPTHFYQNCSPMSKYGQIPEYSNFYFPRAKSAVESGPLCKDIGRMHSEVSVPAIPKHPISNLQEHRLLSKPIGSIASPNHSFFQDYDHQYIAAHKINLNASQIKASLRRTHSPPSSQSIDLTQSSLKMDGKLTPLPNLHEDKPSTSPHVEQLQASPARQQVDQTAATKIMDQLIVSPSSVQINSPFAPHPVLPIDPASLNMNRPLNYSHSKAKVTCPKQPQGRADSLHSLPPQSPTHHGVQIHNDATCSVWPPKVSCPSAVVTMKNQDASLSSLGNAVCGKSLKRSISHTRIDHTTQSINIKQSRDSSEISMFNKRQKMESENVSVEADHLADSPPMPIINNVFSLAPYLKTSGVLLPAEGKIIDNLSEPCLIMYPELCIQSNAPMGDGQWPVYCRFPKDDLQGRSDNPTEKPVTQMLELTKIKEERIDPQYIDSSLETPVSDCKGNLDCYRELTVGSTVEPEVETGSSDIAPTSMIEIWEPGESENEPSIAAENGMSDSPKAGNLSADTKVKSNWNVDPLLEETDIPVPESFTPPQPSNNEYSIYNLPQHLLKLSNLNIIIPKNLHPTSVQDPKEPPVQPTVEEPKSEPRKTVRQRFLALHHSLCRLVSSFVSASPEKDLRNWLSRFELTESASSAKLQNLSLMMGVKAREVWLSEEIKMTLHKILQRLREYIALKQCPFPHVMRTGAVFIPMLVVKELLFSQVQGSFIDQVLQEHGVKLRPTTLSEEKFLTQFHKSAYSNKLKRLLSLEHLPDLYPDVVSLFYHACVHKRLAVDLVGPPKRHLGEGCNETDPSKSSTCSDIDTSSLQSGSDELRKLQDQKKTFQLNKDRKTGWMNSRSRPQVLEEEVNCAKHLRNENVNKPDERQLEQFKEVLEENPSHITPEEEHEYSWTSPLSSDELSSSDEIDREDVSTLPSVNHATTAPKCRRISKNHAGVILKLKRVSISENHGSGKACYQTVSATISNPSFSEAEDGQREQTKSSKGDRCKNISSKVTQREEGTTVSSHALQLLSSSFPKCFKPLTKPKYSDSTEHRGGWALHSAVQRTRWGMKFYPDLVGKRIVHLFEEDDKSEVWYRGEVMRVHEAHPNPLKTVFEVRYDSEPGWKYYLELLIDYEKGWLKIED